MNSDAMRNTGGASLLARADATEVLEHSNQRKTKALVSVASVVAGVLTCLFSFNIKNSTLRFNNNID
jgi:hypothetical protein